MKNGRKRLAALILALALLLALPPAATGQAALSDVYFTAVNEQLLELDSETMPFWSGGVLYVASRMFEGTDLGVNYVRNSAGNLAMLYTSRTDLRFDLEEQLSYDKEGKPYTGHAIERGGIVFFPLDLVCNYFGLSWTLTRMDTAPLIRVTSSSAILDVDKFVEAIAWRTDRLYEEYEKSVTSAETTAPTITTDPPAPPTRPSRPGTETPSVTDDPPSIQAAEGQRVYLLIESSSAEDTKAVLEILGGVQATFLLTVEQMSDGDRLRGLIAEGHSLALLASGDNAEAVAEELAEARELLWQAACSWLELVWYEGRADIAPLLEEEGCVQVHCDLDRQSQGLRNASAAETLLQRIGRTQEDVAVYLGRDSGCLGGLDPLLDSLGEAGFRMCGWRLTA